MNDFDNLTPVTVGAIMRTAQVVAHPSRSNHNAERTSIMAKGNSSTLCVSGQTSRGCFSTLKDLTGKTFGRWLVIKLAYTRSQAFWFCRCECGGEKIVRGSRLRDGKSRSCGCLGPGNKTHGKTDTAEYGIWCGMKRRCYNKADSAYRNYGGRGIRVCERWLHSFENFLADVGPRPSKNHELDRFPDNNGDYRPGNCRWTLRKNNGRNKRNNHRLAFDGKLLCISEWAELTGLTEGQIRNRLRIKWSVGRTLTTPVQPLSERVNNLKSRIEL